MKKNPRKLHLFKETLRPLNLDPLDQARGGMTGPPTRSCPPHIDDSFTNLN